MTTESETITTEAPERSAAPAATSAIVEELRALIHRRSDTTDEVAALRTLLAPERALAEQRLVETRQLDQEYGDEIRALKTVAWEELGGCIPTRELGEMRTLVHEMDAALTLRPRVLEDLIQKIDTLNLTGVRQQGVGEIRRDAGYFKDPLRAGLEAKLSTARRLLKDIQGWIANSPNAKSKLVRMPLFIPSRPQPATRAITQFDPFDA